MIMIIKNTRGFTLIEMLVSIVIFTITISGLTVIFLSIIQTQTKILQTQDVMSQSSYAMEYMGNALRLAKKDAAGTCVGTANRNYYYQNGASALIRFLNYDDKCRQFLLSGTTLQEQWSTDATSGSFQTAIPVTSSKVMIDNLAWAVTGDTSIDSLQPRVTIMLKVEPVTSLANPAQMTLQTSLSQRQLDISQ